jgi:hypothetical protein
MRFSGKCKKCGQVIPVGSRAFWHGSRQGVSHYPDCEPAPEDRKVKPDIPDDAVTLTWGELKSAYADDKLSLPHNRSRLKNYREGWAKGESGGTTGKSPTTAEMLGWLNSGYQVPGLQNPPADLMPTRKRRRLLLKDEGELQLDLAFSGHDYPFLEWERRERKPGLRVNVQMNFAWIVPQAVIAEYQKWVASLLYTLEEIGFDLEVNTSMICESLFTNSKSRKAHSLNIRVKRENEASDFSQWSAMFSPGGLRHLFFLGVLIANDRRGYEAPMHMGLNDRNSTWKLEYSPEDRTLYVKAAQLDTSGFPEARMTEEFQNIMQQIQS